MIDPSPPWDPYTRGCPSRQLLQRLGDKWSVLVLGELSDGQPHRYASIRARVDGVSEKMLTQTLRHLEEDGLLTREVFAEVPPRVQYRLTDLGTTLREPISALRRWSVEHATEVMAARATFRQRNQHPSRPRSGSGRGDVSPPPSAVPGPPAPASGHARGSVAGTSAGASTLRTLPMRNAAGTTT